MDALDESNEVQIVQKEIWCTIWCAIGMSLIEANYYEDSDESLLSDIEPLLLRSTPMPEELECSYGDKLRDNVLELAQEIRDRQGVSEFNKAEMISKLKTLASFTHLSAIGLAWHLRRRVVARRLENYVEAYKAKTPVLFAFTL